MTLASCLTPSMTENGPVWCRTCWKCIENKKNEKVGRMIAESKTAKKTLFVTLTYKSQTIDDNRPILFHKEDIDRFIARLKKRYGRTRYVITGEKGEAKGRVHFHAILFFYDIVPDDPLGQTHYMWAPWHHGYTFLEEATSQRIRYTMKYAIKESMDKTDKLGQRFRPRYSNRPPLGHDYLQTEAIRMAQAGIKPKDNLYFFAEDRKRKYHMTRNTRDNFLDTYTRTYQDIWHKWPHCDVVDEQYEDEIDQNELFDFLLYDPEKHPDYMAPPYTIKVPQPYLTNENPFALADLLRNVYGITYQGIPTILITEPDKSSQITSEAATWHANPALTKRILRDAQIQWRVSFNEFKNNPPPDPVSVIALHNSEPPF